MKEQANIRPIYRVISVEKISTPEGMTGDNWHHYVVGHDNAQIEGKRTGTLKSVSAHAETFAEDLNSRRGLGGSTYAPRKKK